MAVNIDIQYNPFLPQLTVLIDGKQPTEYSQVTQFTDEDIWKWRLKILDVLYSELCDDFFVTFIGTELDTAIMRWQCENHAHCVGFATKLPDVNISLQKRLGDLNQFIKNNEEIKYQRTIIEANFIIPMELQEYLDDVLSIDINNLYCSTRIQTSTGINNQFENRENSFLFILTSNIKEGEKILEKYQSNNPVFIICKGKENKLKEIHSSYLLYECDFSDVVSTIFKCFLGFPLIFALRKCVLSISGRNANNSEIMKITAIEPSISIGIKKEIEVGKSNAIQISCDPPLVGTPKISFRILDNTVATTDGLAVFGVKTGKTKLEAYRYGAKTPFQVCEIKVIQRNRIKKIILDEDELILGVGDAKRLTFDYSPVDADNLKTIQWKSTNENIVEVDSRGNLLCKSTGRCGIICVAENVSATCNCEVRPYLESMTIELPANATDISLEPMQEYELQIKTYPVNSIDSNYTISSSAYDIVNVIGNKIIAKKAGTAIIEVVNSSKRKSISCIVKVSSSKHKFLRKLLGR